MRLFIIYLMLLFNVACQSQHANDTTKSSSMVTGNATIRFAAAHWLTPDVIVINNTYSHPSLSLINSLTSSDATQRYPLTETEAPEWLASQFPHLAGFTSYRIDISDNDLKQLLKQPLIVVDDSRDNATNSGTRVQISALLDQLYTSGENDADEIIDFGARITDNGVQFKLWAPTAISVKVLLFDQEKQALSPAQLEMIEDSATGVWSALGEQQLAGQFYRYQLSLYHPASGKIETLITTDPYSLSLSTNSEYSHIIDLNDTNTMPLGWQNQQDNPVNNPEDNIFYETHIRDFSAFDSTLTNKAHQGKYLAFTDSNSDGVKHLTALKQAGVNSIHLLPTFDIGTINENSEQVVDINDSIAKICQLTELAEICNLEGDHQTTLLSYLSALPSNSEQQQAIVSALRSVDNYNWGYDPFHYTVPEGSYAIDPEGNARIVEFRAMIQALHNMGFRVIMDVVYNHTHQAGLAPTAVLDKIVPNYYHRLDAVSGAITNSTCCDNTATEHAMMEKLMTDSLLVWAKDYKIDGFRFDLMAHQPKAAMLRARAAVQAIDPDSYFYGEGWNFGEVANNQRFTQASQLELSGSEIGTFTDRLRDAVRGGAFSASGPDIRKSQGIGNGLATIPNDLQTNDAINRYYTLADQLRIGLTGNLANYPLVTANNQTLLGKAIKYGEQPAGYALDPADTINYVSKHDNQTLWDNNQYRIAYRLSTEQRVRMQLQSIAFVMFAQGIPFIHMGSELLRSKGFLRDSYDYGDWYNKVDFSKQSNNYDIGLPPAEKDQQNWPIIKEILGNNAGRDKVSPADIQFSSDVFLELVKLRMSSPLFRLATAEQIIEKLTFLNTGAEQKIGLFAMHIKGDPQTPSLVVIFNTAETTQQLSFADAENYQLHPILQHSVDSVVKQASVQSQAFSVPGLTTAVFIKK